MWTVSHAFRYLTPNSSWPCHKFLVLQTHSEVTIKGIRVRHAELMAFLGIFKGTVNIN